MGLIRGGRNRRGSVSGGGGSGGYAAPDIFSDDLSGVTLHTSGEFRRAGASIGMSTARTTMIPGTFDVIADPTPGAPTRNVVMIDYATLGPFDAEFGLQSPATAALGAEWWARCSFYFANADWLNAGGKIEQLLGTSVGGAGVQSVVKYEGTTGRLGYQVVRNDGVEHAQDLLDPVYTIVAGQWYCLERRIKINSAYGTANGEYELLLDGVQMLSLTGVPWYQTNNGNTVAKSFTFGTQLNGSSGGASRKRLFRNLAVSTQRIGVAA